MQIKIFQQESILFSWNIFGTGSFRDVKKETPCKNATETKPNNNNFEELDDDGNFYIFLGNILFQIKCLKVKLWLPEAFIHVTRKSRKCSFQFELSNISQVFWQLQLWFCYLLLLGWYFISMVLMKQSKMKMKIRKNYAQPFQSLQVSYYMFFSIHLFIYKNGYCHIGGSLWWWQM